MSEPEWRQVDAILMTSEPIPAYGGVCFPREALQKAADSLNTGKVPMHLDHDRTKPLRTRGMRAWVDTSDGGHHMLRIAYEVPAEDWEQVGERRGMSAAMTVPLASRPDVANREVAPRIRLSADAAWFADEDLIDAEACVVALGISAEDIETNHVYQFSFVPDPQIFLEVILPLAQNVGLGLLCNAIWDSVKLLFRRRQTPNGGDSTALTRVNITLRDGERSLTGIVETDSEAVAQNAIDALGVAMHDFQLQSDQPADREHPLLVWDASTGEWKAP